MLIKQQEEAGSLTKADASGVYAEAIKKIEAHFLACLPLENLETTKSEYVRGFTDCLDKTLANFKRGEKWWPLDSSASTSLGH